MSGNRIQNYFIGHYLRSTDDVFEHARAVSLLRFSLMFAVIFFIPVAVDIALDFKKLLYFHLFDLATIITFPLLIKHSRRIELPLMLLFIIASFSSQVVFMMTSPVKLELVGTTWILFFTVLNGLLQRGNSRMIFTLLIWLPVVYVMVNNAMSGALTVEWMLEKSAAVPPVYMVFVPAAMMLYAVWTHTITIDKARKTIIQQKNEITDQNKDITDSITYARRLQEALLPPSEDVRRMFPDSEIYYKPKAIVAGDFYWMETHGNNVFIAAADCTGHGVPGAMVSVICSGALTRCVKEFGITEPGKILDRTRELVMEAFAKSTETVNDGMDISLLCYDKSSGKISWSGANNALWYGKEKINVVRADKQPIGRTELTQPFTTHEIQVERGTTFYLLTDGYADQFGGPDGKKFKAQQLIRLFEDHAGLPLKQRMVKVDRTFEEWKGPLEQVDDVCIVAVQL